MAREFDAREERFGRYLEEYEVEDRFKHWPGKTVTESDDHLFCLLTLASSPVHTDAAWGEAHSPYGRNIVVGTYVYALLLGMSVPDISGRAIANLGVSDLRHLLPLFHGDTLYGETEVLESRLSQSRPNTGVLTVRTDGFNQKSERVCTFVRSVLLPCIAERHTS